MGGGGGERRGGGRGVYVVGGRVTWRVTMGAVVRGGGVRGDGGTWERGTVEGTGGEEGERGRLYMRDGGTSRVVGITWGWGRLRGGVWVTLMG